MTSKTLRTWSILALLLLLGGCATRPVNPPITEASLETGYTFQTRQKHFKNEENLVILAFSGGGTRAAAFSYGVLEFLRRTEVVGPKGNKVRLLDAVDIITGVSGGSFTALAYGLYGDKLFDDYEQRFLKRDVQGELLARSLKPANWGDLSSTGWGRSELAAQLYDEILFNGATFGDLDRGDGPFIVASATDISTGGRVPFNQNLWNVHVLGSRCRAAVARRRRVVGRAGRALAGHDQQLRRHLQLRRAAVGQAVHRIRESAAARGARDTRAEGCRTVRRRRSSPVHPSRGRRRVRQPGHARRARRAGIARSPARRRACRHRSTTCAGSSSSSSIRCRRPPPTGMNRRRPPGTVDILLKATGVPIDHYSYEAVEQLKDIAARWQTAREIRDLAGCSTNKDSPVCAAIHVPDAEIYAIDVSFARSSDPRSAPI